MGHAQLFQTLGFRREGDVRRPTALDERTIVVLVPKCPIANLLAPVEDRFDEFVPLFGLVFVIIVLLLLFFSLVLDELFDFIAPEQAIATIIRIRPGVQAALCHIIAHILCCTL